MSRSKATKRRKMWAVVDDDGRGSQVFTSWRAAKAWAAKEPRDGTGWRVIPFVQRLPGDVVLSREQSAALKTLAEWEGNSEEPVAWEYGLKPNPNCHACGGKGVYTWQDGHNGDDHESDCDCTRAVALTVGQALAPFRGRR